MRPVDYDDVADTYDRRYDRQAHDGVTRAVLAFAAGDAASVVLEVGCGTGHWLALLAPRVARVVGVDPSRGMLARARAALPAAALVRARAERLPLRASSVDRVLCVNALHHFADVDAFLAEARRVLRPGGGLLTIGLDPHEGRDRWWLYDHFPEALAADRARYLATPELRRRLAASGFVGAETWEAQHIPAERSVREALEGGLVDRRSTSQLMVIDDDAYAAGLARIRAAAAGEGAPTLRADLRLWATTGWLPPGDVPPVVTPRAGCGR